MKDLILRDFISQALLASKSILIPPPPDRAQRVKELELIRFQYHNRKNPPQLQHVLDEEIGPLFNSLIVSAGYAAFLNEIKSLYLSIMPTIIYHKEYFNEPRPSVLASQAKISFESDDLKTAKSPSYPSGHATQAFYLARCLSLKYPGLKKSFFVLAEMISQSRIDRGVHFPSDISAGKLLAKELAGDKI